MLLIELSKSISNYLQTQGFADAPTLLHKSIQTYFGLFDQRTTEASVLQGVAPQQHSNEKVHRGEVQSEYADPHLGDADTDDEQEAVAENGYGILRPDADYRSEVQPTIQQED